MTLSKVHYQGKLTLSEPESYMEYTKTFAINPYKCDYLKGFTEYINNKTLNNNGDGSICLNNLHRKLFQILFIQ